MSEIVDSGNHNHNHNIPLEKSNFSHTFNLLSQYLKENGTLGDLTLGLASSPTATMNLFPAAMKSASPVPKKQPESAQLTIFYAGEVIVVDDFPADKAMKIMMLAGKGTSHTFRPASDWIPKTQPCNLLPSTHINTDKEGIQLLRSHPGVSGDQIIFFSLNMGTKVFQKNNRLLCVLYRSSYCKKSLPRPILGEEKRENHGERSIPG